MARTATHALREISNRCIAARTRLLSRVVSQVYDDALRPLGIKVSQLNVLVVVGRFEPVAPAEVARLLFMEKSTLSRNIRRLAQRGWIEVKPGGSGRGQVLGLTASGRDLVARALPLWRQAQRQVVALLSSSGASALCLVAERVWQQARHR